MTKKMVKTGLERFIQQPDDWVSGRRFGLLCNPASVNTDFIHARELIHGACGSGLVALYAPQHGFFAEKQDNMIESPHMVDPMLDLPVFSLYGDTRIPTQNMFAPIDTLIVDLQDAGTRVYTFISTIAHCMDAAKKWGKSVVVLDRPNPVNGNTIEGNCLSADCESFVGRRGIPMRHGLTVGELALYFNRYFNIQCNLSIVPMSGWQRDMYFDNTGLPWIAPSPNLPTPVSAITYPGQVLWEGTNVSEGRGTTQPFEFFGAPYVDTDKILDALDPSVTSGIHLRPVCFEPTSNKWAGVPCKGFQIHVVDREQYQPYRLTLGLIRAMILHHSDAFGWKSPPYEYEYHRLPIDLLIGDKKIRQQLENMEDLSKIAASWQNDLAAYKIRCSHIYLY